MPAFICTMCGTQFSPSAAEPGACAICQEERQYVHPQGQGWTTLEKMHGAGKPWLSPYKNGYSVYEQDLFGIATAPSMGIGQRALLLRSPKGNILWDCITFLDEATIEVINALGGISAIAISHPHYYTTMVEWSHAFGKVPIYLHEGDREWVMRPDPVIHYWSGASKKIDDDVTLIHLGGHYAGATVMHWARGADGRGAIFSGDTLQVVGPDKTVTFMWSFPNLIPLDAGTISRMAKILDPWSFDSIYGAWPEALIRSDAKAVLKKSVDRYIEAVTMPPPGQRDEHAKQVA